MITSVRTMIEYQLRSRGVHDRKVLAAFEKVPRGRFVPPQLAEDAYGDFPLPIGEGQTISQPYMVAHMTELLDLARSCSVLEIGTGSGYQTAILAELAGAVFTIERYASLSHQAQDVLASLGYRTIHFKIGDGTEGWPETAPFDRIIITAASDQVPPPLFDQLTEGGKLIIPLGESFSQTLSLVEKRNGKMHITEIEPCVFVPLIGKYGMHTSYSS